MYFEHIEEEQHKKRKHFLFFLRYRANERRGAFENGTQTYTMCC